MRTSRYGAENSHMAPHSRAPQLQVGCFVHMGHIINRKRKTLTKTPDEAAPENSAADEEINVSFKDLGFIPEILKALDDLGYENPTPIQAKAIPAALQGRDVLGIAQTGTGKTGAFVLPIMQRMAKGRARARMPRCLIVCPTRELAAQVAENVEEYGKYLKISMALLIGGVSFAEQERKLNRGVDVLIATPGRLLDHFERGKILLTGVQALVVDEADRMLDMGFIPDIERIFKLTPFTRQVLFFSATMPNEIKRLVDQFLHQPHHVQIARKNMTAKTVTQRIVRMPRGDSKQKRTALRYVIENSEVQNGIIFCNRKKDVDIVAKSLNVHGHQAAPIHGDLAQSVRMQTLADFKEGRLKFLVASDVAARGLDVPTVSHVFNYDVPSHSEDYVHRIGRTGRAGRKGDTVMFVTPTDDKYYAAILDMIKVKEIEEMEIPGIEDFPTESRDRNRGRGGRNDRGRGKGRDRNSKGGDRNRNRGPKPDYNKSDSKPQSGDTPKNAAPKDGAKPAPKNDVKKSQERKPEVKSDTKSGVKSEAKTNQTAKQQDRTQEKKPARHQDKPKDQNRNQNQNQNQNQGKQHAPKGQKPKGKYSRDALPTNTESGFGTDMPAFFSPPTKK